MNMTKVLSLLFAALYIASCGGKLNSNYKVGKDDLKKLGIYEGENALLPVNKSIENLKTNLMTITKNGIVFVSGSFAEKEYGFFRSVDGGGTWENILENIPGKDIGWGMESPSGRIFSLISVNDTIYTTIYRKGPTGWALIASADFGESWFDIENTFGDDSSFSLFALKGPDNGLKVIKYDGANNQSIWSTYNGGKTFNEVVGSKDMPSGLFPPSTYKIGFDDRAFSSINTYGGYSGKVYVHDFNGRWNQIDDDRHFLDNKELYSFAKKISLSGQFLTDGTENKLYSLFYLEDEVAANRLAVSHNNGDTWQTLNSGKETKIQSVFCIGNKKNILGTSQALDGKLVPIISKDNGKNWIEIKGFEGVIHCGAFHPAGAFYIGTNKGVYACGNF